MLSGLQVLIRVDGTTAIGLGHVMRMRSLAEGLKTRGARIVLLSQAESAGEKVLRDAGLVVRSLTSPSSCADIEMAMSDSRPDIVIVDTLDTSHETISALRGGGRLVTFDDCAAGLSDADAVINAIVFHWGRYEPGQARARLYEGPEYMILPADVVGRIGREVSVSSHACRIVISVGGTDTRGLTPRLLQSLEYISQPLAITANIGPGAAADAETRIGTVKSRHHVRVLRAVPSLAEEFSAADLVLCGGGNMLYELAALGVPAAAIATEEHEIRNIAYWTGRSTTEDLGHWSQFDGRQIAARIGGLLDDAPRRQAMSRAGRAIVDGHGLERCMDVLAELVA